MGDIVSSYYDKLCVSMWLLLKFNTNAFSHDSYMYNSPLCNPVNYGDWFT